MNILIQQELAEVLYQSIKETIYDATSSKCFRSCIILGSRDL